jgi:hypothetical protein
MHVSFTAVRDMTILATQLQLALVHNPYRDTMG